MRNNLQVSKEQTRNLRRLRHITKKWRQNVSQVILLPQPPSCATLRPLRTMASPKPIQQYSQPYSLYIIIDEINFFLKASLLILLPSSLTHWKARENEVNQSSTKKDGFEKSFFGVSRRQCKYRRHREQGGRRASTTFKNRTTRMANKNKINQEKDPSGIVSVIKLKRTDTTLDLSQKAKRAEEEKKKIWKRGEGHFLI